MKRVILKYILIVILLSSNMVADSNSKPISINDFGAIPDDNIDDSEAIKKALNVNGYINMNRGVYNVSEVIRIDEKTVIDGNGSTFLSRLDTTDGGRTSKNILTLKGDMIVVRNLILDGAYTNGNAKEGENVSSLLHIYDSKNILLENIKTINHSSNWWSSKSFDFSKLNSNHLMDMYHVIYIGFSDTIMIKNMEQLGNIKTEGLLIYESDNITIDGFNSFNSPNIWTSLHIVASDNIIMNHIDVGDGSINQGGSSINFIANHKFLIKNTKTTTKQGFDISNEIRVKDYIGRVTRDSSDGIFENCHFEGQRALYGYPVIKKIKNLIFRNTKFVPTKEGYATWGLRVEKIDNILFEGCSFGSKKFKTAGVIMGDSENIIFNRCRFINPSVGVYLLGKKFGKLTLRNNIFQGQEYSPINFYWSKSYGGEGKLKKLYLINNQIDGKIINNNIYNINGNFKIERVIK